jgi:hypothetical protein
MGDVQVPVAEKMSVEASVLPLCQENKYTVCAAQDDDPSPLRRSFIKFHLWKNKTSLTPTITALYDTGTAVSLITPSDFDAIPGMTCRVQNASQQPMQTEGAWRVRLYLKGRYTVGRHDRDKRRGPENHRNEHHRAKTLGHGPGLMHSGLQREGAAAALGVLGQREDGTIADVRVLRATTIPGRHGQLLRLGLFNSEQHRIHASVATLVDMVIMAASINPDAMGGFSMHIPNADYKD